MASVGYWVNRKDIVAMAGLPALRDRALFAVLPSILARRIAHHRALSVFLPLSNGDDGDGRSIDGLRPIARHRRSVGGGDTVGCRWQR